MSKLNICYVWSGWPVFHIYNRVFDAALLNHETSQIQKSMPKKTGCIYINMTVSTSATHIGLWGVHVLQLNDFAGDSVKKGTKWSSSAF